MAWSVHRCLTRTLLFISSDALLNVFLRSETFGTSSSALTLIVGSEQLVASISRPSFTVFANPAECCLVSWDATESIWLVPVHASPTRSPTPSSLSASVIRWSIISSSPILDSWLETRGRLDELASVTAVPSCRHRLPSWWVGGCEIKKKCYHCNNAHLIKRLQNYVMSTILFGICVLVPCKHAIMI